jgi:hypothetical protein
MDRREGNTGPSANDRINKRPTSAAQGRDEREFDIAGNVEERGEAPSPDNRDRGERSSKESAGTDDADRRRGQGIP